MKQITIARRKYIRVSFSVAPDMSDFAQSLFVFILFFCPKLAVQKSRNSDEIRWKSPSLDSTGPAKWMKENDNYQRMGTIVQFW